MKKFQFSLEKVLKHRHMEVDLKQKDLFEAESLYDKEVEKLRQMEEQKASAFQQRTQTVQETTSWAASVEQINLFLSGQDLRIKKQNERLLEVKKVVEARREILQKAMSEAKMIEKLKEKKKAEFLKEAAEKEQQEMDELSVVRFSRTGN